MVKIGVNAIGTRHSGAAAVLRSLLRGFAELDYSRQMRVFLGPLHEVITRFAPDERIVLEGTPAWTSNPITRALWLNSCFRRHVRTSGCDVVLNFNNMAGRPGVPQVLFLQQSLFLSEEAMRAHRSTARDGIEIALHASFWIPTMKKSARNCELVVVQTDTMREWVRDRLGVSDAKLCVLPPALPIGAPTESGPSLRRGPGPSRPRVLYVGSARAYKNLRVLTEVAELARQRGQDWQFHLTTSRDLAVENPNIVFHGHLSTEALSALYESADVLVMPSLVETVGLPLLEAMQHRCPVVAADRPYAREICGRAALYFDPLSPESLYEVIRALLADVTLQEQLRDAAAVELARFPSEREWAARWVRLAQGVVA